MEEKTSKNPMQDMLENLQLFQQTGYCERYIKQNNSQEKKHGKYSDVKLEEFNKNNMRNNKIIKKKKLRMRINTNIFVKNFPF